MGLSECARFVRSGLLDQLAPTVVRLIPERMSVVATHYEAGNLLQLAKEHPQWAQESISAAEAERCGLCLCRESRLNQTATLSSLEASSNFSVLCEIQHYAGFWKC